MIPTENQRELKEIPKNVTHGLNIVPVRWIDQVLELALTYQPQPLVEENDVAAHDKSKLRKKSKRTDTGTKAH